MSELDDLIFVYLLLFGILLIPFLEILAVFCIVGGLLSFPLIWIPLYYMMFPVVYVKERSALNQLWTGKGPYKVRARQYNPITGRSEKIKIY